MDGYQHLGLEERRDVYRLVRPAGRYGRSQKRSAVILPRFIASSSATGTWMSIRRFEGIFRGSRRPVHYGRRR